MKAIVNVALRGASLIAIATPGIAAAQGEPEQSAGAAANQSVDIIVTARRREESAQDVPSVVNAVTSDDISKLNLREFTEVKSLVPGLQLANTANGIGGNAQLRGITFDVNASGNNPTVEFYQNDAPITAGVVLQQIYDIGQIEVLRGPQGTLRGRASPSGSITVTTHKPDLNAFGGYADLTANDIGTQNVQGALNLPLIEGVAGIRVAGVFNSDDAGRVRTISTQGDSRAPYSRTSSGRVSGLLVPTDWLRLEGVYQRIDRTLRQFNQVESNSEFDPTAAPSPVLIRAKDRRAINANPRNIDQNFDIYNGRAEVSALGQQLIYQFQHYTQKINSRENTDPANIFPTTDTTQTTILDAKATSHELRLQNQERVFGIFDYVIGLFDNRANTPTSLNSPTVVRLPIVFGGGVATVVQTPIQRLGKSHEQSVFGNITAHIGDSTQASGGLRFIHYRDNGQLLINGAALTNDRRNDKKVIYSASLQHNFTRDFMLYASTGSSYRPGITAIGDFNITRSALENSFLTLPEETSRSYEIGLKSTLFDRRLRFNLSGFHQKFKNYPYRSPGGVFYVNTVAVRNSAGAVTGLSQQVAQFNFVGAVPVEVNGVEAEVSGEITSQWTAGLVAAYALGKIKNGSIPCTDLNGDGLPDTLTSAPSLAALQAATGGNNLSACRLTQRSASLPPFSATLQSEYRLPVSNKVDAYLRGLFTFFGSSQGDPANTVDDINRYGLLNVFAGVRDPQGQWELNLYAKNVLDEFKVTSRGNSPLSTSYQQLGFGGFGPTGPILTGPTGTNTTSRYTNIDTTPLREFGINFKFRFGSR
jgi:iron complex outermembrane receptor protein